MAVRSITRGGGKAYKPIVDQLKELEKKFRDLQDAASDRFAQETVRQAGKVVFDAAVASAASAGIPHKAMEDFFISSKPGTRRGINVLVGLRKRGRGAPYAHGYVEWFAGRQRGKFAKTSRAKRSGKQLVMPALGRKIGENLATMWELGTTKMAPRPWFRTAVLGARDAVTDKLADGYRQILQRFAQ